MTKIKVSYHSGKGYARHNNHYPTKRDKGNINHALTAQNVTWTAILILLISGTAMLNLQAGGKISLKTI